MDGERDAQGQPAPGFNAKARQTRAVHELIGICRGIVADKRVVDEEVKLLHDWLTHHKEAACAFPGGHIAARLQRIYADGIVTDEERNDLMALIESLTGEIVEGQDTSARLPIDSPAPAIVLQGKCFCFTGKFVSGTRRWHEEQVETRGGIVLAGVSFRVNYLVLGSLASRDWAQSSFGRKIEQVMEWKKMPNVRIAIISEEHWLTTIQKCGQPSSAKTSP